MDALFVVLGLLLLPSVCLAWGPAAHLGFGLQVLDSLILLPPLLRRLLRQHKLDYLYGCVAADIVVGKNMARGLHHCHNWSTALRLLDRSRRDDQRALSLGFMSHLAADVVAHNYFVPAKSVQSFSARSTHHAYWEIRYDQLTHGRARVWRAMKEIARLNPPHHNQFLARHLARSSVLMPIQASRRLFKSMMLVTSRDRWRQTTAAVARRSPWKLSWAEGREFNRLAVENMRATLEALPADRLPPGDPIGKESLRAAKVLRRRLKRLDRRRPLRRERWDPFFDLVRRRFRESMAQPLDLPPLKLL